MINKFKKILGAIESKLVKKKDTLLQERTARKINRLISFNILQANVKKLFQITKGKYSPFFIDHTVWLSNQNSKRYLINEILKDIKKFVNKNTTFIGIGETGVRIADALGDKLGIPVLSLNRKKDKYGLKTNLKGNIQTENLKDKEVIVIDDHISYGHFTIDYIKGLRKLGVRVKIVYTMSCYNFDITAKLLKENNVTGIYYFSIIEMCQYIASNKLVDEKVLEIIMNWLKLSNADNPQNNQKKKK